MFSLLCLSPRMFTACQLHYPPSSFFHSPAAPLRFPRSSSAILSTFANSVAAPRHACDASKREPELAWNVSPREASLPSDENGLKSSEGLGFRLPGRELERNHEKGHSTRLEYFPPLAVCCLRPSFLPSNRLSPYRCPPPSPAIFSAPNFRANSPDEFHASRDERVTSRSTDR